MRFLWFAFCALAMAASAERAIARPDPVQLAQARNATVGLAAGQAGSTDAQAAADLAQVLDDGDHLRVVPIQGNGSAQNLADLVFRKGVDLAIVHTDVVTQLLQDNSIPREETLRYITNLFQEEVHILARPDIATIADLNGQPVDVGITGSDSEQTAKRLFGILKVNAKHQHDSDTVALDRLRLGEVAAMVVIGGQPVPLLRMLGPATGLHFLPIPITTELLETYLPTKLDHRHYPNLVPAEHAVSTISAGAVLVTLSAPRNSPRAKRVNRFVDTLFSRFQLLRDPGHHPKWQEVNLAARVPGLTRYSQAETLLQASTRLPDGLQRSAARHTPDAGVAR